MLKKAEVRALIVLRIMAQRQRDTGEHVRPIELLREKLIEREWERLEIWREYPFQAVSAPQLYLVFDELSQMGLIEDFSAVRAFALDHKMSVGMLHVLAFILGKHLVSIGEIGDQFADHLGELDAAMNRLERGRWISSMPNGSTILWQPTDKAVALIPAIHLFGDLSLQADWDLSYWINTKGIAFANQLNDDWRAWTLPEGVKS